VDAPGTLPDQTYVDVLAFLLQQNGFPSGRTDLTSSTEQLDLIRLAKSVPLKTGTFVQIVGCLQRDGDDTWSLVQANDPTAAPGAALTPADIAEAQGQSPGKHTIGLVNVDAGSARSG